MIPVIIIEGATATGKTTLALELAETFDTEIISADSRQIYKYLDIGTAKPSRQELAKVKHHLIDIINPDETYNAGLFSKQALNIIMNVHQKGKIPIIAGGTGLYIKALLEGLFETENPIPEVKIQLEQELLSNGLEYLYLELKKVDQTTAARVSHNDKQRILRALEVYRSTGHTISEHWLKQTSKSDLKPFRILLNEDRDVLYNRINQRVEGMVKKGLIDEIKSVIQMGFNWSDPGFNSVGYKEFQPCSELRSDLDKCIGLAQQHTRNYAKRQTTWYKKCNYNLAEVYSLISINEVEGQIIRYFE